MDQDIKRKILNLHGEDFLENLAISFLDATNENESGDERKRKIVEAFLSSFIENFIIMVVNNCDTDQHLAELLEESKTNLKSLEKRKLLKTYIKDFDKHEKALFDLHVHNFLKLTKKSGK